MFIAKLDLIMMHLSFLVIYQRIFKHALILHDILQNASGLSKKYKKRDQPRQPAISCGVKR